MNMMGMGPSPIVRWLVLVWEELVMATTLPIMCSGATHIGILSNADALDKIAEFRFVKIFFCIKIFKNI